MRDQMQSHPEGAHRSKLQSPVGSAPPSPPVGLSQQASPVRPLDVGRVPAYGLKSEGDGKGNNGTLISSFDIDSETPVVCRFPGGCVGNSTSNAHLVHAIKNFTS